MRYQVEYNPGLSRELINEMAFAFSPSMVSSDREQQTAMFSLDTIVTFLDKRWLVTATEQDVVIINKLLDEGVNYVEVYL